MKKILSIDGGGIRGLIPATVLNEIEIRTKKPIASLFDLIAGTSTGGIIALGLVKPSHDGQPEYTAADLVNLYEKKGPVIFHQGLLRTINNFGNLLDSKYADTSLERILLHFFKNTLISQSLTDILITAYELERRDTFFFKSNKAKKQKNRDFLMRDAARATSAAPTYFEPEKIPTEDLTHYYALIDGGVFANNPTMCAYVEARNMFPEEKDFLIVSLGTGQVTKPIYYEKAKDWGVAKWAQPILNVVFDGINDAVDYQLRMLLPTVENKKSYFRFQVQLDEGSDAMDNTDPKYIRALKLYAESLIKDQNDSLDSLCKQLI